MADNGTKPSGTAEKQLGEIVADVTQKAQLLVREEIELAKTEVQLKVTRIGKGVAAFAAAGFFALLMLIFLLHTLAWGIRQWFDFDPWVGYGITTLALLLIAGVAGLVGLRFLKKGTPPTPELALEEAQATRRALEEVRR